MGTMVANVKDIFRLLNHLIELDYDAIEAYKAAIERLSDASDRSELRRFHEDHERHVLDLTVVVRGMGGDAPESGDIKQILTTGRVVIGGLMGDRAVLHAMKSNEDATNLAYERAAARTDLPENVRELLEKNLLDERRHRAWFTARLEKQEATSQR